jgi:ABC-2 type transport system permease protein
MKKIIKYLTILRVNSASSSVYLVNLISQSITVIFRVWIYTQLYRVTYQIAGTKEINDLSLAMVVWSLALAQSFQTATIPSVTRMVDEEVKTGSIAYTINRPYSYILFHYFSFLGRLIPRLLTNLAIAIPASIVLVGLVRSSAIGWTAGAFLLFFGYLLDFSISMIIGLFAFWTEDTSAFRWIYNKGALVLGGLIVPLSLFPDSVRRAAEVLPFSQLYYSAARIMVNYDAGLFWRFFTTQITWIIVFSVIAFLVFRKGVKNVSINGG